MPKGGLFLRLRRNQPYAAWFRAEDQAVPANNAINVALNTGITATFTPLSNLEMDTAYTATITTGVKDRAGNPLAADYSWLFTTGSVSDTTPPEVISTTPEPDASNREKRIENLLIFFVFLSVYFDERRERSMFVLIDIDLLKTLFLT